MLCHALPVQQLDTSIDIPDRPEKRMVKELSRYEDLCCGQGAVNDVLSCRHSCDFISTRTPMTPFDRKLHREIARQMLGKGKDRRWTGNGLRKLERAVSTHDVMLFSMIRVDPRVPEILEQELDNECL